MKFKVTVNDESWYKLPRKALQRLEDLGVKLFERWHAEPAYDLQPERGLTTYYVQAPFETGFWIRYRRCEMKAQTIYEGELGDTPEDHELVTFLQAIARGEAERLLERR